MKSLSRAQKLILTLVFSSLVSLALLGIRVVSTGSHRYSFLAWNLFLAWLPMIFAVLLLRRSARRHWFSASGITLTILWFIFLPNSFYIASDFVHLQPYSSGNILFDAAMLLSFTFNGLVLGYAGVYLMHIQLLSRLRRGSAHTIIGLILLFCSFAIYLGRFLRWNTWDILVNPAGLILDITDPLVNPRIHAEAYATTLTFLVLLGTIYSVSWQFVRLLRRPKAD